jgi:hypothetical protein
MVLPVLAEVYAGRPGGTLAASSGVQGQEKEEYAIGDFRCAAAGNERQQPSHSGHGSVSDCN